MQSHVLRVTDVPRISVLPNRQIVLQRLGYSARSTVVSPAEMEGMEEVITTARSLCEARGRLAYTNIVVSGSVVVGDGIEPMKSAHLATVLARSSQVAILGVTVGTRVMERIHLLTEAGRLTEAVIHDAVASEAAEAAMAYLHKYVRQDRSRFGQGVTRRYSPGYGDLLLVEQRKLHEALRMQDLGVILSSHYMLIPEKSALAIVGIERTT